MSDQVPSPAARERHRLLAGESRVRVLEVLRAAGGPLGIAEVAERVDLHPNTVRLHLGQLAEAGLVEARREERDRPGRPRLEYAATRPATDAAPVGSAPDDGPTRYQALAEVLVGHLERTADDPTAEAIAAGRAWGRSLGGGEADPPAAPSVERATVALTGMLAEVGFAPRPVDGGRTIELHHCPFRQVAAEHSPVVCGVHLGLMQGALARSGAPVRATRLEPFVTPDLCLAHLEAGVG